MNQAMVDAVSKDAENAARRAAEAAEAEASAKRKATAVYLSIVKDPNRTSEKDKAALIDAMKILGKTPAHLARDVDVIGTAHGLEADEAASDAARDALTKAQETLRTFINVERLEMQKQIQLRHKALVDEVAEKEKEAKDAAAHCHACWASVESRPDLAECFPPQCREQVARAARAAQAAAAGGAGAAPNAVMG